MDVEDISYFSDAHAYDGKSAFITNGCYLIRHEKAYMLWDAGLPLDYLKNTERKKGWLSTVKRSLVDQLAEVGVEVGEIVYLGVSHFHGDHIGQAKDFADATLLMSEADADYIRSQPDSNARRRLTAWFDGASSLTTFRRDHDVFGDASVVIIATPGHTPGHSSLLVRLKNKGAILLTGDAYHFRSEIGAENVSRWNTSRADTLASMKRLEAIAAALDATIVVQHDPEDVSRLPVFPQSAQ